MLAALAAIAVALQTLVVPIDADVSWLITVSERVLAGQRLYVDIFEVNPPASVWLYVPQVALAHMLSLRPEAVVAGVTLVAGALSAWTTRAQLARLESGWSPTPLLAVLAFLTLVAPGGLFAQREHYALLLCLPVAAVMARLATRDDVGRPALILGGCAAGLMIVIKPHFVFAVVLPAAYALWKGRKVGAVAVSAIAAATIVALYALAILFYARAYLDALPMLAEVYGPMRQTMVKLLTGVAIMSPIAVAAIAYVLRPTRLSPFAIVLLSMLLGFTVAAFVQGKGYWNHALPATSLGILAIALGALTPGQSIPKRRLSALIASALGLGLLWSTLIIQPPKGLVAELKRTAPARPTIISLGTELSIGHPATRLVDGTWVGTRAALFTAAGVRYRTANWQVPGDPRLKAWYDEDLAIFVRDLRRHRPEVVLEELESTAWLSRDPRIAAAMRPYRKVAQTGTVAVWVRADLPPTRAETGETL